MLRDFAAADHVYIVCGYTDLRKSIDSLASIIQIKFNLDPFSNSLFLFCDKIFKIDHQFDDLPPDERQKEREKILRPVVNKFFQWAESMSSTTSDSSKFGKAIKYALNQRNRFEHVFLDGRLELSNNRAERSIKPFVIGRKNFLFANTARGAKAGAVMYSITETAIENGLLPFAYIKWVLDNAPALSQTNPSDWAVMLAPHNAPDECRANRQ